MRIPAQQLFQHLKKSKMPFYLLYGPESFLLHESAKLIRQQCEAEIVHDAVISTGSDVDALIAYLNQPSLFASSLLIDCKIAKFSDAIMQKIVQLIQANPNTTFLLQMPHLSSQQQKMQWFHFLEQKGGVISHFRDLRQFGAWIEERAKQQGVLLTPSLRQRLFAKTEGNYLALAQEIDRLRLLGDESSYILEQGQYEVKDLIEAILSKKSERVIKILSWIKETGEGPQLVIWNLTQILDLLLRCSIAPSDIDKLLHQAGIRTYLHSLYRHTLKTPLPFSCSNLLACLFSADNQVKSGNVSSAWHLVLNICLQMTGIKIHVL